MSSDRFIPVAQALRWSTLGTALRFALQLGAQVALARLLGPHAYGVYGIGLALLTFLGFLAGNAFSWRLMLRETLEPREVRLAFTWQVLAALLSALALWAGAAGLSRFFGEPELAPVLRWLALACLLTGAGGTAVCMLQRALRFRELALLQSLAYAAGYLGVGLPLALAGWQAEALGLACVVQAGVTLAGALWLSPHPARPLLRDGSAASTLRTGRTVFITNTINWLLGNLDRLVIGRLLGGHAVGLYTLAWNLAQVPVTLVMGALQPALLAAGTPIAQDRAALAQRWQLTLAGSLVLLPVAAGVLSLLAADLVQALYGPAWAGSAWVLAVMLACLPAWCAWGLSTPLLWNTGQARLEAGVQWPLLPLALALWWMLAPHGLPWAVAVSALLVHLRAGLTIKALLRLLPLPAREVASLLLRGIALMLPCAGAAWLARATQDMAWLRLLAGAAAGGTCAVLMAWRAPAWLGAPACEVLSSLLPFAPFKGRGRDSGTGTPSWSAQA